MARERFDFSFIGREWKWVKCVDGATVCAATRGFGNLSDCIADARGAGFNASIDARKPDLVRTSEMPLSPEAPARDGRDAGASGGAAVSS